MSSVMDTKMWAQTYLPAERSACIRMPLGLENTEGELVTHKVEKLKTIKRCVDHCNETFINDECLCISIDAAKVGSKHCFVSMVTSADSGIACWAPPVATPSVWNYLQYQR